MFICVCFNIDVTFVLPCIYAQAMRIALAQDHSIPRLAHLAQNLAFSQIHRTQISKMI